jgi:LysM repeat protein
MLGTARTKPFSRSLSLVAAFALLAGTAAVAPAPAAAAGPATVALPAQFVGGYVEAWQSRTYPSNVPHANMTLIAFATTTSNRNVRMSYPMPRATLRASIATNTAAGKPTILSLGGAGGWHAPTSTTHVATMANDLIAIIEDYGFSGLDVNFEGGSAGFNEGNARFTASMMRRVHDHFTNRGQHFSLSIAPYGANPDGRANNTVARTYQEIMRQNVDIIDFVGFQYYNTGFPVSTTWVRNVLEHWKAEVPGMTNDQWALGFLRAHDWGGSTTPYPTMVGIWNDLKRSHPGVRGVWTWGVNEKETPTGYGFFTAFRPIINTTQPAPTQPAPTQPAPTQPAPNEPAPVQRTHTVVSGDTLLRLGQRYGVDWRDIQAANGNVAPERLYVGQVLVIPGGSSTTAPAPAPVQRTHTVVRGDTLYLLGLRYGVSWTRIQQANGGIRPEDLRIGQVLIIPS